MKKLLRNTLFTLMLVTPLAADTNVSLTIKYPKPVINGTPKPLKDPNLDPVPDTDPIVRVPAGTTLLSHGKPVTGSDTNPINGSLSFVTDGDKTGIDGSVVECGPGLQWVQIDLGVSARVAVVAAWHFHSERRVYHDVVVQISDEPAFARNVVTIFNNDGDNSARLGKGGNREYIESHFGRVFEGKGASGRYVRLYSNGNTSDELNHYCEVEVYGVPATAGSKSTR